MQVESMQAEELLAVASGAERWIDALYLRVVIYDWPGPGVVAAEDAPSEVEGP